MPASISHSTGRVRSPRIEAWRIAARQGDEHAAAAVVIRGMRLGLALLLLSAPCWWIGAFAFFPVLGQVYSAPDSATQLRIVSNHPTAWIAQNLCFLLGLLAASAGLAVLTPSLRGTRGWRFAQLGLLTTISATVVGMGVVYNSLTLAERQTPDVPPMYSGAGANPLHTCFGVLTLVGFIFYGVALVRLDVCPGLASRSSCSAVRCSLELSVRAMPSRHSSSTPYRSCSACAYCFEK